MFMVGVNGVVDNEEGGAVDGWECALPIKPRIARAATGITSNTRRGDMVTS